MLYVDKVSGQPLLVSISSAILLKMPSEVRLKYFIRFTFARRDRRNPGTGPLTWAGGIPKRDEMAVEEVADHRPLRI